MLPSQASGAYGISFEIDINRGDDLSLKEHWQDHAQPANGKGHGSKRAAAEADGGKSAATTESPAAQIGHVLRDRPVQRERLQAQRRRRGE